MGNRVGEVFLGARQASTEHAARYSAAGHARIREQHGSVGNRDEDGRNQETGCGHVKRKLVTDF